ncbi:helix-turn-helix transcriptional regulator [Myceligenerans crystallogenes]|uniref:HTH cro/C1-type domain-containing protein n=1 Tax=Myceligenerans crystallogenes TaxID=316335 RepID=A0ABP4ZK68_9MICO
MSKSRPLTESEAQALGHRMQKLRMDAGLTQEAVAQQAGISRNHYQLLERGLSDRAKNTPSNPGLTTVMDIAAAIGVTLAELLADIVDPWPGEPETEHRGGRRDA